MKNTVLKILKIAILALSFIGLAVIALFPFENRDITVKIYSSSNKVLFSELYTVSSIKDNSSKLITLQATEESPALVRYIRFYGLSKTTIAKEIDYNEFSRNIDSAESGSFTWTNKGLLVSGDGSVKLNMNNAYSNTLKILSASMLQERLILAGFYLCFMALLFIICNIFQEKLSDTKQNNHAFTVEVKKFLGHFKKYKDFMDYSARADLNAEVANSYLNRFWWLLEPLFNMIVYVVVFGRVMGNSVQNYATFVFSALLMWNYFNKIINYSVKLVRNNRDIVTKVYVPKFVLLFSNMILNFYKFLFSLIVLVIMLIVYKVHIGFCILGIIPAFVLMLLLSFGIGMILLHFGVYIDDLSYAVNILLTMLMFLSGVFYNVFTTLSYPLNVLMICLNPVSLFIDVMRNALLYNTIVHVPLVCMWLIISLILCYIGVHIVYKNENSYVKIV